MPVFLAGFNDLYRDNLWKVYATFTAYIKASMWLNDPKQSIWRTAFFSCTCRGRVSPRHLSPSVATNRKWTACCSTRKLKALNRCALRETSDKSSGRRPTTGIPQASSTLLHAVLSTPQCSEQAIPRIDPEQGVRVGVRCSVLRVDGSGHDMQKAVKAMRKKRKKARVCNSESL